MCELGACTRERATRDHSRWFGLLPSLNRLIWLPYCGQTLAKIEHACTAKF
jgi:hypothetical protein